MSYCNAYKAFINQERKAQNSRCSALLQRTSKFWLTVLGIIVWAKPVVFLVQMDEAPKQNAFHFV